VCLPVDTRFEADSTLVVLDYIKQSDDHNVWSLGTAKATINFNLKEKPDDQMKPLSVRQRIALELNRHIKNERRKAHILRQLFWELHMAL